MNIFGTNKNKAWLRLITLIMISTFLCQDVVWAKGNSGSDYKLSPMSRWSTYWNDPKHQLDERCMDGFIYATMYIQKEISKIQLNDQSSNHKILSIIDKVNAELDKYDISIIRPDGKVIFIELLDKKEKIVNVPYLVFKFGKGDNSAQRVVLFNLDPDKLSKESRQKIGLEHKDLKWFKVPGSQKVWIVNPELNDNLQISTGKSTRPENEPVRTVNIKVATILFGFLGYQLGFAGLDILLGIIIDFCLPSLIQKLKNYSFRPFTRKIIWAMSLILTINTISANKAIAQESPAPPAAEQTDTGNLDGGRITEPVPTDAQIENDALFKLAEEGDLDAANKMCQYANIPYNSFKGIPKKEYREYLRKMNVSKIVEKVLKGDKEAFNIIKQLRIFNESAEKAYSDILLAWVSKGDREALDLLVYYHEGYYLVYVDPKIYIERAENGDKNAIEDIKKLAEHDNEKACEYLFEKATQAQETDYNLLLYAIFGKYDKAVSYAIQQIKRGDKNAILGLRNNSAPEIREAYRTLPIKNFLREANKGSLVDIEILIVLSDNENKAAKAAVPRLSFTIPLKRAEEGSYEDAYTLLEVSSSGHQKLSRALRLLNIQEFVKLAEQGQGRAIIVLHRLWVDEGHTTAGEALANLDPSQYIDALKKGDRANAIALGDLAFFGNKKAIFALSESAEEKDPLALEILRVHIDKDYNSGVDSPLYIRAYYDNDKEAFLLIKVIAKYDNSLFKEYMINLPRLWEKTDIDILFANIQKDISLSDDPLIAFGQILTKDYGKTVGVQAMKFLAKIAIASRSDEIQRYIVERFEELMQKEGLEFPTVQMFLANGRSIYAEISDALKQITDAKPKLKKANSLSSVLLSRPVNVRGHAFPHFRIYQDKYFTKVTGGKTDENKYSIALAVYKLIKDIGAEINGDTIRIATDFILKKRAEESQQIALGADFSVINIAHDDSFVNVSDIEAFERSVGIDQTKIQSFQGDRTPALNAIKMSKGKLFVFIYAHGDESGNKITVSGGSREAMMNGDIVKILLPIEMDMKELIDALVARGDLENVFIVLNTCHSGNFVEDTVRREFQARGLNSFPVFIAASARGRIAIGDVLLKAFNSTIGKRHGTPFKLGDVFKAEKGTFEMEDPGVYIGITPEEREYLEKAFGKQLPSGLIQIGKIDLHTQAASGRALRHNLTNQQANEIIGNAKDYEDIVGIDNIRAKILEEDWGIFKQVCALAGYEIKGNNIKLIIVDTDDPNFEAHYGNVRMTGGSTIKVFIKKSLLESRNIWFILAHEFIEGQKLREFIRTRIQKEGETFLQAYLRINGTIKMNKLENCAHEWASSIINDIRLQINQGTEPQILSPEIVTKNGQDPLFSLQRKDIEKDIKYTKVLLGHIKDDSTYEVRYNGKRLSESQQKLINTYCTELQKKRPDAQIKPIANMDDNIDYIIKVTRKGADGKGEGKINIEGEDELNNYPLRIIGMLNMALAASNLPTEGIKDDDPLVKFIKEQYKAITGEYPDSEIKLKNILLKKPEKIDSNEADRLNKLAEQLLTSA